jgi:CSLREA domain-containing protein
MNTCDTRLTARKARFTSIKVVIALLLMAALAVPARAQSDVPPPVSDVMVASEATTAAEVVIAAPVLPMSAEASEAATINVNTTNDEFNTDGDCSLREAIESANQDKAYSGCTAGSGVNDQVIVPAGIYTLTLPTSLRVTESAFIRGAGASTTVVDANNNKPTFVIDGSILYVCDASDGQVLKYSAKGTYDGVFIGAGGAPALPNDIATGSYSTNEAYVYVSGFTGGVKYFNRNTGAPVGTLSTAGSTGAFAPTSIFLFQDNLFASNYQPDIAPNKPGIWQFTTSTASFNSYLAQTTVPLNSIVRWNGKIYATDPTNNLVLKFDDTGTPEGTFASGSGLNRPRGFAFGADAELYVANELGDNVLRFDGATGAFQNVFIAAGSGGLDAPQNLAFGPDGNLYVLGNSPTGKIIRRYNGTTGAYIDDFVSPGEGPLGQASCLEWMEDNGTGPIVHLSDMTIQRGSPAVFITESSSGVLVRDVLTNNSGGFGGGISNAGFLQVFDSTISDNDSFNFGGAIQNSGAAEIGNSTLSGNFAPNAGGAIFNATGANLTIYNTTISGNRTNRAGGGIQNQGNAYINNSTITANSADSEESAGDYGGGGIINVSGNVFIRNTIIAGNTDYPAIASEAPDCEGTITSYRHNLIGNNKNCTLAAGIGDQVGTPGATINPLLGPLADNGGPTPTHKLVTNSPAINAGSPTYDDSDPVYACREKDQRGYDRALGGRCDVGAYEVVTFTMRLSSIFK